MILEKCCIALPLKVFAFNQVLIYAYVVIKTKKHTVSLSKNGSKACIMFENKMQNYIKFCLISRGLSLCHFEEAESPCTTDIFSKIAYHMIENEDNTKLLNSTQVFVTNSIVLPRNKT